MWANVVTKGVEVFHCATHFLRHNVAKGHIDVVKTKGHAYKLSRLLYILEYYVTLKAHCDNQMWYKQNDYFYNFIFLCIKNTSQSMKEKRSHVLWFYTFIFHDIIFSLFLCLL